MIHKRAETSSVGCVRYHSSYLTHTYTWRHAHKHSFHGNRIQGLLWLVVCPGLLKMVSAAVQRQEIYGWVLNNRTGANIDRYTASCLLLPEAEFLLKLTKKHIRQVNSSLWDIPPVTLSCCLGRVCTHSSSCNVEISSNDFTCTHTHTFSSKYTHADICQPCSPSVV